MPGEAGTGHPGDVMPGDAGTGHHKDNMPRNACTGHPKYFCTSRLLNCTPCLAILHILQLGYPLRCIHSVEAGLSAFRCKEGTSNSAWLQEYAYFLTHDISMMRLMETFLENSPQLILLLYIVLQRGEIQYFQYFSISSSFLSISWSIVDYHRSLRLFLKDKQKLNICSSAVYFLWNFFLILPRILCITLFASVFHCWIALHFLMLWVPFFLWVWLQKTDFMQRKQLEHIYRATVAVVLYFSWFNIADGRTIHRCLIYHIFITTDSLVLLISWKYLRFPSIVDYYEMPLFLVVLTAFFLGLLLRWFYYTLLHPNLGSESRNSNDEPDFRMRGAGTVEFKGLMLKRRPAGFRNPRMLLLSRNMY
ncbi:XK-related protein 8 [Ascaphus truei]|uniref:XK-related protein 8 n=1 Tax=Ascaphus truei TaxID=8439 RepID=UPI003F5ACB80